MQRIDNPLLVTRRQLLGWPAVMLPAWPSLCAAQPASGRPVATGTPGASGAAAKSSHFPFGEVNPVRRTQPWPITTHAGQSTDLARLLRGKTTALQFMFTGCTASCPIQGALFAQAQILARSGPNRATRTLPDAQPDAHATAARQLQWLSLSIDALADSPARLQAWLQKFSAQPGWLAAVPAVADVDRIQAAWGEGGQGALSTRDPHSGQVFVFNRAAELVYRTAAIPPASDILRAMLEVAKRWP